MNSSRSDFLWTLCGRLGFTGANGVMMLGLYLSDPEGFPLERFASVLVFIQAQLLVSRLLLLGQDQSVVRFWPEHRGLAVRHSIFWIALTSAAAIPLALLCGLALEGTSRSIGFLLPVLVATGAAGQAFLDAGAAILMARLRFRAAGLLLSIGPFARAAAVLVVAADQAELAYTLGTVALGLAAVALAMRADVRSELNETDSLTTVLRRRAVLRYGTWIALADALVILSLSAAVFSVKMRGDALAADSSRLAFAMAIAQGHFAVFLAFYQSLLPRAAHCRTLADFDEVFRHGQRSAVRLAFGLVMLTILAIAVLNPIVERFRPAGLGFHWPLVVLTAFMVALVFEAPFGVAAQFLKRPRLQVQALTVRASIACGLAWALSFQGVIPAVAGQSVGAFAGLFALVTFVNRARFRYRAEEASSCAASQA